MKFFSTYIIFAVAAFVFGVLMHNSRVPSIPVPELSKLEETLQREPVGSSSPQALHIPIVIYHTVHPLHPGETRAQIQYNVPPDVFEEQLKWLRDNGYTTISLTELEHDLKNGTTSPVAKPVVLTFDDGWQNQYTDAFPLLMKYHDTATFYVYTNPIGKDDRFLTWDEIQEMYAAGMEIGSHSLSHPYFKSLTAVQLHKEVFDSKATLEKHLRVTVRHFASPFGYTDATLQELLAQAGYSTGRTTYRGTYHADADRMHLTGYFAPQNLHDFSWLIQFAP